MVKVDKKSKKKKIILISVAVVVIAMTIGFFAINDLYVNGPEYREMVNKCGTKQLIVGESIPKDPTPRYRIPNDPNYRAPFPQSHYFCTEQDAKAAGYLPLYNPDGTYNSDY